MNTVKLLGLSRYDNTLSSEFLPAIKTRSGAEWWYLDGKLHRGKGLPAVIDKYSVRYYWRGVLINKEIANKQLSIEEIISIDNIEARQAAMDIYGYTNFINYGKVIDTFTPPEVAYKMNGKEMYQLLVINQNEKEVNSIVMLAMYDPNKKDTMYVIRVHHNTTTCKQALALSYGFDTYEEYAKNQVWEGVRLGSGFSNN